MGDDENQISVEEAKDLIINGGYEQSAQDIIDIMLLVEEGTKRENLTGYVFEHKSFLERPISTQRSIAREFHFHNGLGSWLCKFGLSTDTWYMQAFVGFPYGKNRSETVVKEDIRNIALNTNLNHESIRIFLYYAVQYLSESNLLLFFRTIPEERLGMTALHVSLRYVPEDYSHARRKIIKLIRSRIESEETCPKDLPDEWILKIADFKT